MEEQRKAVRKMQVYIKEHLREPVSLRTLAQAVSYSPWYARKLFIRYIGMSPAVYIRRLKLSDSALRLRDDNCSILEAALDSGYESEDGYQRAFRREFGCNPREYANSPVPLWLFAPYFICETERKQNDMSKFRTVFIQLIEKPARKVILKRGIAASNYYEYCEEVGCDVWGLLKSIRSLSGEPVCLWLPRALRDPAANEYVQGVEVEAEYSGVVPEGFDVISLPASQYLLFRGEPFEDEDFEEAIGEIWEAEKKYDPAFIGYQWDDSAPRIQLEPVGERGYIELMPVKALKASLQ